MAEGTNVGMIDGHQSWCGTFFGVDCDCGKDKEDQ